tara:strand:+ start:1812 stop:2072 length:261 start_codon:yes stop_codon:yes gene_type:complete
MNCSEWCICCILTYYLGCGTLFIGTICHEKYHEYQKIKKEYENFPREIEIGSSKSFFTMNQREYERLHPPRNIVLSIISEESITDY